ncbi:MAG: hypothetical protein CL534_23070 [Ahrensia sp.]|nr:hypothetical protein [Ahrensia sp.]
MQTSVFGMVRRALRGNYANSYSVSEHAKHNIRGCMCRHVHDGSLPVRQVIRHYDGFWEFNCGVEDHPDLDDFVGLCADCNRDRLADFKMLVDLQPGQWAQRASENDNKWELFLLPPEDEGA